MAVQKKLSEFCGNLRELPFGGAKAGVWGREGWCIHAFVVSAASGMRARKFRNCTEH
jgi:hypothetical protein